MKTISVIGAGLRGQFAYAPFTLENNELKIVAVAESDPFKRASFQKTYNIEDLYCFSSDDDFFNQPKLSDALIISTMDKDHYKSCVKAIKLGYDILLEKPISPDLKECLEIEKLALKHNTKIMVCHVLRYTPFYQKIKEIMDSNILGKIVNVEASENVAHWHQAHSFVRGNWRNSDISSPMILQKCCHDMDIYAWLLNSKAQKMSSFGSLLYFNTENSPVGAPKNCLNKCPHRDTCPYDVYKIYLSNNIGWPTNAISADLSYLGRYEALQKTSYGNCVFHSDNNVVDNQIVNIKFENGTNMVFTMTAFTQESDRVLRIMGTKGELKANMIDNYISITSFETGVTKQVSFDVVEKGHMGGDYGIMQEFCDYLYDRKENTNPITESVHSHVMALAAEKARIEEKVIDIQSFIEEFI